MLSTFTPKGRYLPNFFLFVAFISLFLPTALEAGEEASGAIVRIENMTKVPGSNRGFPAEDYFTFHRILNDVNSRGLQLLTTESNQMRIHNDGTGTLLITKLTTTNPDNFKISGASIPSGGLSINPGKHITVTVTFLTDEGRAKRLVTDKLVMNSNADNASTVNVTFRGAYMAKTEGANEIDAQQVFESFGFQTKMGRDKYGNYILRPSSDYPTDEDVNAGVHGDLILSGWFKQADPNKPIRAFHLAAFHGPGEVKTRFLGKRNVLLGDMEFVHGSKYHQSLIARASNTTKAIAGDYTNRIDDNFKIAIGGYKTTGGTQTEDLSDQILGVRVYRVIDYKGQVVPNEYIALMDYIGSGCGEGSSNCDWNDNAIYIINARPEFLPTAGEIPNLTVQAGKSRDFAINGAFDRGYAGNAFTFSASKVGGGSLPSWVQLNKKTGVFTFRPPSAAVGNLYEIKVTAKGYNGVTVSSNFGLVVDDASISCTVDANTGNTGKVLSCSDGKVRLSGFTSTGIYRWTGPNGFSSTSQNPTVSRAGIYHLAAGASCDRVGIVEVFTDPHCGTGSATNTSPVADASASRLRGEAPLQITLDGTGSQDPDGSIVEHAWAWAGNSAAGASPDISLEEGNYDITLTVRDNRGKFASDVVTINVGPEPVPRQQDYWLEAECAVVGTNWRQVNNSSASGGKYVVSDNRSASTFPADVPANRVRFQIDNVEKGRYYLLARILAPSSNSDSYWVRVNGNAWFEWKQDITESGKFEWNLYGGRKFPSLQEGSNTIDFAFREANTGLDKLLISRTNALPTGLGESTGKCGTVPNSPPLADATVSTSSGTAPLTVTLDGSQSRDPDGSISSYNWKWAGGSGTGKQQVVTLGEGTYAITLTVKDNEGATNSDVVNVVVAPDAGTPPPPPPTDGSDYWLEAECAAVGSKWSVEAASGASNGSYVVVNSGNSYKSAPADQASNRVRFAVNTSAAGNYYLFARVSAPSGLDDSFYFRVNDGSWYSWNRGLSGENTFTWKAFPEGTISLRSGNNTIDFAYREDGTKLDKLYLTTSGNSPSGSGGVDDNCDDLANDGTDEWLEIECGNLGSGWSTVNASAASNDSYIVYTGQRNLREPGDTQTDRKASYSVDVTTEGNYNLYLRLNAPTVGDNSVWIQVDDGEWVKMWKEIGGEQLLTNGFEWRKVNDDGINRTFYLSAGEHTITIANRESGTMLDKFNLSLSNQPPVGEGIAATNCPSAKAIAMEPSLPLLSSAASSEMQRKVDVYPNPVADELNLIYTDSFLGEVEIVVYDFNGRAVKTLHQEKTAQQFSSRINIGDLPSGVYHLRVFSEGNPGVKPFVKQ